MQSLPPELIALVCSSLSFASTNALSACSRSLAADCALGRRQKLLRWRVEAAPLLPVERSWFSGPLRPDRPGFATLRYRTVARCRLLRHAEHDPRLTVCREPVVRAALSWSTASPRDRRWYEWYVDQVVRPPRALASLVGAWLSLLSSVGGSAWSWTRAGPNLCCLEQRLDRWHLVGVLTHTRLWPTSLWSGSASAKVVAALEGRARTSLALAPLGSTVRSSG